ncbi:hypothetical protein INT44_007213 [Umbelopsis vinacea]|uniref:Tetraspanin n=1 Tax=Umbelopsis vinacea TaxID=44442 RepID=A0A8H7PMS5_9FUNG|nr:hypothetical protein INT44_007213 [Umbelopsis vinacea]
MSTSCCTRLSKIYMVTTNSLFAALGLSFLIFGLLGYTNRFHGAIIIPDNIFQLIIVLAIIILVTSILGLISAYSRRRCVIYIYMVIVAVALILQVVVGVLVYQKGANYINYINTLWTSSSNADRLALQNEFNCCGLTTASDKPAISNTCDAGKGLTAVPCATVLQQFVHSNFSTLYLVVFAALAFEVLALTNAITLICAPSNSEEERERRMRRKSGIKLEDMSTNSSIVAGSNRGNDNYSQYAYKDETSSTYEGNRYDNNHNAYNRQENGRYY